MSSSCSMTDDRKVTEELTLLCVNIPCFFLPKIKYCVLCVHSWKRLLISNQIVGLYLISYPFITGFIKKTWGAANITACDLWSSPANTSAQVPIKKKDHGISSSRKTVGIVLWSEMKLYRYLLIALNLFILYCSYFYVISFSWKCVKK